MAWEDLYGLVWFVQCSMPCCSVIVITHSIVAINPVHFPEEQHEHMASQRLSLYCLDMETRSM